MRIRGLTGVVMAVAVASSCADAAPPGGEAQVAGTLEVRCDGGSTDVLTPVVQARPDGVHVVVRNHGDDEVLFQWEGGGDGVGPGEERFVLPIFPGRGRSRCLPNTPDVDPGRPRGWHPFDVLESEGWISPQPQCAGEANGSAIDHVPGAKGVADPLADARREADAEVVQAGYATDDAVTIVVLDAEGRTERAFEYASDGRGGWLLSGTSGCS